MSGKLIHNLKRQRAALRIVVAGGQAMASAAAASVATEEQPLNLVLTGSSASSARISGPAPSPSSPHLAAAVLDYLPAKRRRRRTAAAAPPTPAPAPARAAPPPPSPSPPPPPQLAPAVAQRDFLQIALQKVLELQRDLSAIDAQGEVRAAAAGGANAGPPDNGDAPDSGNEEEDERFLKDEAEALGFAMCAREALQFLADAGEPRDGELVRRLRASLVGGCAGLPI